jgi:[CysO sulfur-carrier protein]-S-L-cysteine hydrolase
MLTISRDLQAKIIAHARADHPDEACGVIAGPAGSDRPERFIPMQNAERSPTFYRFDSREQLKVWREMDDRDEEPVVIYHSHTATEAYPSRTDVSYASEPQAHYVLVSTRDEPETEFRSYRITDGVVTEEPVSLTELCVTRPCCHPWRKESSLRSVVSMAIEVRIPTILRSYTGGAKSVQAAGSTLGELLINLDAEHGGLRERLVDGEKLRRFVNVYLNDEDVRFLGGLETPVADGDTVTVLPAVAGGSVSA